MFLLTIGTPVNDENIKDNIHRQLDGLRQEGMDIIYDDYILGDCFFIKCGLRDNFLTRLTDKRIYEDFKYYISRILVDEIVDNWEVKLVKKIIKENYFYLCSKEKSAVVSMIERLLKEDWVIQDISENRKARKNKLITNMMEYFTLNDVLNIDGFVNFRMNNYISELNAITDRAVELFVAEREYNEFIKLLKYFVEIQECKIDAIHLIQQICDGRYIILDSNKNRVNNEYLDELKGEMPEGEINYDDLLISTLITISPKEIYIHNAGSFKNRELLRTINSVFCDRIHFCSGCEICNSANESKETNLYKQ